MAARISDWDVALTAADEARRLAEEFADPQAAAAADTAISLVAAMRGDEQTAELMAARAEMVAEPVGANITMAFAQFGKVLAALASRPPQRRVRIRRPSVRPADSAYHPVISSWLIADLAEAARHIDQLEAARARVCAGRGECRGPPGHMDRARSASCPGARGGSGGSRRALRRGAGKRPDNGGRSSAPGFSSHTASGSDATGRSPTLAGCLRAARDTFDALGCATWAEQARRELRASGERSRRRVPEARDQLTAQELQIAQLAADGPVEPRDRPATVSLAPHDQHAPVPGVPEARDHFAS